LDYHTGRSANYQAEKTWILIKINFFQHCHNGDVFVSREFVKQIVQDLENTDFQYFHKLSPRLLLDIPVTYQSLTTQFNIREKFSETTEEFSINTWVGAYDAKITSEPPHFYQDGINLKVLYQIWNFIFSVINEKFNTKLKLKDINHYIPEIDFQNYHIADCANFLKTQQKQKLLICNGEPKSKQSFRENFNDVIDSVAERFSKHIIICTEKFKTPKKNILFTEDIIKISDCDLIEISYLSESCDLIVGRNSGPFVYCLTKNNLLDKNKTLISFNYNEQDNLVLGTDIQAEYIFSNRFQKKEILDVISDHVR